MRLPPNAQQLDRTTYSGDAGTKDGRFTVLKKAGFIAAASITAVLAVSPFAFAAEDGNDVVDVDSNVSNQACNNEVGNAAANGNNGGIAGLLG